ncbi:hypothetical protein EXS65_02895 [Candidatus Peribacteria bacterium]|nr:hypothetical protein [Candidatus Peribacteria bacterium]
MVDVNRDEIDGRGSNPFFKLTPEAIAGLEGKCIALSDGGVILVSADSHRELQELMRCQHPSSHYNSFCLPSAGSGIFADLVSDIDQSL